MHEPTSKIGFVAATLSMLMMFAASATPTPLTDTLDRSISVRIELGRPGQIGEMSAVAFKYVMCNHCRAMRIQCTGECNE